MKRAFKILGSILLITYLVFLQYRVIILANENSNLKVGFYTCKDFNNALNSQIKELSFIMKENGTFLKRKKIKESIEKYKSVLTEELKEKGLELLDIPPTQFIGDGPIPLRGVMGDITFKFDENDRLKSIGLSNYDLESY